MRSVRTLIIIALSVIAVSLIVPFYSYSIFALKSNLCPKYCDGCCVSTKPKNSAGLAAIGRANDNQKALVPMSDILGFSAPH